MAVGVAVRLEGLVVAVGVAVVGGVDVAGAVGVAVAVDVVVAAGVAVAVAVAGQVGVPVRPPKMNAALISTNVERSVLGGSASSSRSQSVSWPSAGRQSFSMVMSVWGLMSVSVSRSRSSVRGRFRLERLLVAVGGAFAVGVAVAVNVAVAVGVAVVRRAAVILEEHVVRVGGAGAARAAGAGSAAAEVGVPVRVARGPVDLGVVRGSSEIRPIDTVVWRVCQTIFCQSYYFIDRMLDE